MIRTPNAGALLSRFFAGRIIGGRYRLGRPLGAGSMGMVFAAEHLVLGKPVAIKLLRPRYAADPQFRRRFLREARSASRVSHQNVVRIVDFGQERDGAAYIVMERLDGCDLRRVLDRQGRVPWWRARPILQQITSGLFAAHERGVVHRDVKPENCILISVDKDVRVKLCDFGIARNTDRGASSALTQMHEVLGTAAYMAPELALGAKADARTDIYAVGVLAYELLTGSVPFEGPHAFDVMAKHLREEAIPMRVRVPAIPARAEELIERAMSKQPSRRFQTMREFGGALTDAVPEVIRSESRPPPSRGRTDDDDTAVGRAPRPGPHGPTGTTVLEMGPTGTQVMDHLPVPPREATQIIDAGTLELDRTECP